MSKIIYDIGANNGDNIPYYLEKAEKVVAVEAINELCMNIEKRFSSEIDQSRLVVVNCAVVDNDDDKHLPFYMNRTDPYLGSLIEPEQEMRDEYTLRNICAQSICSLISKYGEPFYIKLDIEGFDHKILNALFTEKIFPPYISAEAHNIEVFTSMVSLGGYNSFKLVDGESVSRKYKDKLISTNNEHTMYSFPYHSAGPFGNDINGDWMNRNNFFRLLGWVGLGWKDIHASKIDSPNENFVIKPKMHVNMEVPY